jgi:nucleoside-diphosphate-sugar epimerase
MGGPVVITGAGGFVGRALAEHFRGTGRPFRPVFRIHGDAPPPAGVFAVRDLATAPDTELDAIVEGAAAVVHLAARVHVMRETAADPSMLFRAHNVVATARLAQAALSAGATRFVFASTVKVNGEATHPGRPFRPDDPPAPQDAYARSKLEAERELLRICAGSALAPIVLRLPLIYGPGVAGNFLALEEGIAGGRALPLGSIRNRRSVLYVGNLVEAIDAALDARPAPRGVHFVADADSVAVPDLVRAIAASLGVKARLRPVPVWLLRLAATLTGRRAVIERLANSLEVDTNSFREATGWRPHYTLPAGLAATARWWRIRHAT